MIELLSSPDSVVLTSAVLYDMLLIAGEDIVKSPVPLFSSSLHAKSKSVQLIKKYIDSKYFIIYIFRILFLSWILT